MKKTFFSLASLVIIAACNNASKQDVTNSDSTTTQTSKAQNRRVELVKK